MLSGTYERITARTVSVDIHFRIPCSKANDIPNVLLPVPGHPAIKISLGGVFPSFKGGGELKVRRCFTPPAPERAVEVRASVDENAALRTLMLRSV